MRRGIRLLRGITVVAVLVCAAWPQVAAQGGGPAPSIDLRARTLRPGEVLFVSVTVPGDVSSVDVRAFERTTPAYRLSGATWNALVGIDLDQAAGDYRIAVTASTGATAEQALTVTARTFPTRTLKVNPDFVNPPPALMARIEAETRFTQTLLATVTPQRLWATPFRVPVPHKANSRFGTRSVFNGEARNPHAGTDFLSPAGTPIQAPNAGRVVAARDLFFSGRTVILDHGLGVFSQLAHMSRIDVAEGDLVRAGQIVGRVGATGRVTGAHLHWGLRVGGARVDPLSLIAVMTADSGDLEIW
jgi:murein DD-endopeptidase MepM/ murein hydrolase activator NlpD